jgi:hypothetical protein
MQGQGKTAPKTKACMSPSLPFLDKRSYHGYESLFQDIVRAFCDFVFRIRTFFVSSGTMIAYRAFCITLGLSVISLQHCIRSPTLTRLSLHRLHPCRLLLWKVREPPELEPVLGGDILIYYRYTRYSFSLYCVRNRTEALRGTYGV